MNYLAVRALHYYREIPGPYQQVRLGYMQARTHSGTMRCSSVQRLRRVRRMQLAGELYDALHRRIVRTLLSEYKRTYVGPQREAPP
jgi:hypothetical protein